MTNQRAIVLLSQMYIPAFDEEEKDAITKAIEALTAQEPRVMTLEEVKALVKDEVVYFQPNSVNPVRPRVIASIDDIGVTFSDGGRWQYNEYGNRFCLWTSRPTDKQMEATPWMT